MSHRSADVDILQRIATVAQKFSDLLPSKLPSKSSTLVFTRDSELPPRNVFSTPEPLTSQLIFMGLDLNTADRISHAYLQAARQLKDRCEVLYHRASAVYMQTGCDNSAKLQSMLRAAYTSRYTKMLKSWVDEILSMLSAQLLRLKSAHWHAVRSEPSPDERKQSRRPFNQDALPVLVAFFEHNAFPSRVERQQLASKTGLEYRQINVWFQNRRTRFKKEGKDLKRVGVSLKLPPELGTAIAEILSEDGPEEQVGVPQDALCLNSRRDGIFASDSDFNIERPPHVFPSSYPPACAYNPFPILGEQRFEVPWVRTCSKSRYSQPNAIDIVELTDRFAKLSIHKTQHCTKADRVCLSKGTTRPRRPRHGQWAAIPNFTTVVPPAPLPALLHTSPAVSRDFRYSAMPSSLARLQSSARINEAKKSKWKVPPLKNLPNFMAALYTSSTVGPAPSISIAGSKAPSPSNTEVDSLIATGPSVDVDSFVSARSKQRSLSASSSTTSLSSQPMQKATFQEDWHAHDESWRQSPSFSTLRASSSRSKSSVSIQSTYHPYLTSARPAVERKMKPLPGCSPAIPVSNDSFHPLTLSSSESPHPFSGATLSRVSSMGSLRSFSSSSSDSEGPLTPPLYPVGLPIPQFPQSELIMPAQLDVLPELSLGELDKDSGLRFELISFEQSQIDSRISEPFDVFNTSFVDVLGS